jgi:hypothetical protein
MSEKCHKLKSVTRTWLCGTRRGPRVEAWEIPGSRTINASAGISYNKFLAKLASDHRKPNGQYVITPEMGSAFVETLPVGKFHGIGPATAARLNSFGIHTGLDLRNQTFAFSRKEPRKIGHVLLLDFARHRRSAGPSHGAQMPAAKLVRSSPGRRAR